MWLYVVVFVLWLIILLHILPNHSLPNNLPILLHPQLALPTLHAPLFLQLNINLALPILQILLDILFLLLDNLLLLLFLHRLLLFLFLWLLF